MLDKALMHCIVIIFILIFLYLIQVGVVEFVLV